jgi:hypothetical protein
VCQGHNDFLSHVAAEVWDDTVADGADVSTEGQGGSRDSCRLLVDVREPGFHRLHTLDTDVDTLIHGL